MNAFDSSTGLSPRVAAPLAYAGWWLTGAIFWLLERRDPYVRFHAAQAIAVFGLIALLLAVFGVLAIASLSFMPGAFTPLVWVTAATGIVGLVLWAASMWQVAFGRPWRLPLAGTLAERMNGR